LCFTSIKPAFFISDFEALWVELVNKKPYGLDEFCADYQDLSEDPSQSQFLNKQADMSCDSNDDGHHRNQPSNSGGYVAAGTGSLKSESADHDSASGVVDNGKQDTILL
jgi:hypothetical protein